jgi:hypothetical protein
MSNLINKLKTNDFITTNDLLDYIAEKGIENVRFIVPMKQTGIISPLGLMISSNDPDYPTKCKITENRYQLKDNYKISLTPCEYEGYIEHYYISDLIGLIKGKFIQLVDPELNYEPSFMEKFKFNIRFDLLMNVYNHLGIIP